MSRSVWEFYFHRLCPRFTTSLVSCGCKETRASCHLRAVAHVHHTTPKCQSQVHQTPYPLTLPWRKSTKRTQVFSKVFLLLALMLKKPKYTIIFRVHYCSKQLLALLTCHNGIQFVQKTGVSEKRVPDQI